MNETLEDKDFRNAVAIVVSECITECLKGVYPEKANLHLLKLSYLLNQDPCLLESQREYYEEYFLKIEVDRFHNMTKNDSYNENDNK